MKNVHVLQTDKPSRIIKSQDNDFILLNTNVPNWFEINLNTTKQNIYITSDEEIKEGDWFLENSAKLLKWKMTYSFPSEMNDVCKKIILTTDQDLINDGVQEIDDEFLEWFVKNPSCESVEIEESNLLNTSRTYLGVDKYKIIILKEEPKQETLEEVAERLYPIIETDNYMDMYDKNFDIRKSFIEGAKWRAERICNHT